MKKFGMARNKNLEKSVIELTESMQSGVEKRLETLETVRSLANELNEHDKNVHIAKVSGSSFSIAGFVLIAVGFGLAPVTLGTSTILSAVGGAMCAGGGTTAAGSSLLRNRIFKRKLAKAQEIIDADRQAQESVQKLLNELYREVSALSVGDALDGLRESSFNMTRGGDEDIEGGLRKFLDTRRGGSENVYTSKPTHDIIIQIGWFSLNNLMTCATQLYHVVYRYNKCSLSNYYILVHPKNALENCITTVSQVCHSINH